MAASVHIGFGDRDEVLHVIERGGEMMEYFVRENAVKECPLIHQRMKFSKEIASGKQGSVHTYSVDNTEYVVKKSINLNYELGVQPYPRVTPITLEKVWLVFRESFPEEVRLSQDVFYMINGGDKNKVIRKGDPIYTIEKKESWKCKTDHPITVNRYYLDVVSDAYQQGTFTYPKGSFLCKNESYSEFVIGLMCSKALERGRCANFLHIFGISMCSELENNIINLYDYTFMELAHGTLKDLSMKPKLSSETVDSIIIQTIFAISYMQRVLGIQHNDLHAQNVMYIDLNEKDVKFRGKALRSADYFSYEIDGTYIYFKNTGYLAKIVDFGFAMKYSEPIVGRIDVTDNSFTSIPQWRDDYYDLLVFMASFGSSFDTQFAANLFTNMLNPYAKLEKSIEKAVKQRNKTDDELNNLYLQGEEYGWRPKFTGLSRHPWEYLTDPEIMGNYIDIPPEGSSVAILGVLSKEDYYPNFSEGSEPLVQFTEDDLS
jgi:serine/threonine protein kinase